MHPTESNYASDAPTNACMAIMALGALPFVFAILATLGASPGASGYGAMGAMFGALFAYVLMVAVFVLCSGFLLYSLQKGRVRTPTTAHRLILLTILSVVVPFMLFN